MDKIAVLGGGSLGLLLAGKLKASGSECVLWTRTEGQASLLNHYGLTLEDEAGQLLNHVSVDAYAFEEVNSFDGQVVLLAVKQTALTPSFMDNLARVIPIHCTLVLFQNGVGHRELLSQALPGRSLLVAVTTEGAKRINETSVRHTGKGETRIGEDDETDRTMLHSLERLLEQAGFTVILSKELEEAILRKLLINAVINPLTAILRIRNGELIATNERKQLMQALFHESYDIVSRFGLTIEEDELWNDVLQVCLSTSSNESSMLQDVSAHQETEVDFINGAICKMAARLGREAPWNRSVMALVKAIR